MGERMKVRDTRQQVVHHCHLKQGQSEDEDTLTWDKKGL